MPVNIGTHFPLKTELFNSKKNKLTSHNDHYNVNIGHQAKKHWQSLTTCHSLLAVLKYKEQN